MTLPGFPVGTSWSHTWAGRLEQRIVVSEALRGNPLGDPHERPVWVQLPASYDDDPGVRYPVVYVAQGYTGQVSMWANRRAYAHTVPEQVDALLARGDVPPVLVVYLDAWTSYGGSQFVDSCGTGDYCTYVSDDVVRFVDAEYRTVADPRSRAVAGKSSGGFAAMLLPVLRPDVFAGGLATHAGDALYEGCYLSEHGKVVRALRRFDGDPHAWWDDFVARGEAQPHPDDMLLLLQYGCSAAFTPGEDLRPVLPFDTRTGKLNDDLWSRWLALDPVRMAPAAGEVLRSLSAIWVDAGTRDEWYLDLGAEAYVQELRAVGVSEDVLHHETYDQTHAVPTSQYVKALRYLAERLPR